MVRKWLVLVSSTLPLAAAIGLATTRWQTYGFVLFLLAPLVIGMFGAAVFHLLVPRVTIGNSLLSSMGAVVCAGILMIGLRFEGLICLLMAAPIALPLAMLGGLIVYHLQGAPDRLPRTTVSASLALLLLAAIEPKLPHHTPLLEVRTAVEIGAPPQAVWNHVVSFSEIPPPTELLFRSGIAYPIRATIAGKGPGAIRKCVFSTGPFVEPIEVWDEPRRLSFKVTENPEPMHELSPYPDLKPPHLEGTFTSKRGQFLLTELPGGRTRLEGTTWYVNEMWPISYWRLWSDYIVRRIHLRVLEHIKQQVESSNGAPILGQ